MPIRPYKKNGIDKDNISPSEVLIDTDHHCFVAKKAKLRNIVFLRQFNFTWFYKFVPNTYVVSWSTKADKCSH
jgi:hypothetical protein